MANMIIQKDDSQSRDKIIKQLSTNFIVEAGAGSGKTTMLVNRMVALVESGVAIEKICAITFTKAAAAEFYKRFQELLSQRSVVNPNYKLYGYAGELPAPTKKTAKLCAKALENIDLCFMNTIDSFCQMVLSEHPLEAGIPSDAVLLTGEEMNAVYRELYIKIRNGQLGNDLKEKADLFKSFYWNDSRVFEYGVDFVMGRRNIEFQYDAVKKGMLDVDKYNYSFKTRLIKLIQYLITNPMLKKIPYGKVDVPEWKELPNYLRIIKQNWNKNLSAVLRAIEAVVDNIQIKKDIELGPVECLDLLSMQLTPWNAFDHYEIKSKYLDELYNLKYSVTMDLLNSCSNYLDQQLRKEGKLSYFDYLLLLKRMLDKDSVTGGKLAEYIYNRHSYILIDEFQDTNPMQAEIFFQLTAIEAKADWRQCIPKPGSLFIVGDPKQSIYRFRGADVSSYIKIKELFNANVGEILYLTKNFRSTKKLREYYNRAFELLLPDNNENQCKFEKINIPASDVDAPSTINGVYTYECYAGDAALLSVKNAKNYTDDKQIVKVINRIVHNPNCLIKDKNSNLIRQVEYGDIMVISPSKARIPDILARLYESGIKYKSEGKVLFEECNSLKAIVNILSLVANPTNPADIINVLNGDIFNFASKDILFFICNYCNGRKISLYDDYSVEESDSISFNINNILKKLGKIVNDSSKQSPAAVFQSVLEGLEIFKYVSTDNMEILYYTLELIRSKQHDGSVILLEDCIDYIMTLMSGKSDVERCLSLSEDTNKVHVANLHKVKGLEAPVVILAYYYPRPLKAGFYTDYTSKKPKGYLISCDENTGAAPIVHFKTSKFVKEAEKEHSALSAEVKRLIYVAATRAESVVIISKSLMGKNPAFKSNWNGRLVSDKTQAAVNAAGLSQYDNDIFQAIPQLAASTVNVTTEVIADDLYEEAKRNNVLNDRTIEEKSFTVKTPSGLKLEASHKDDENENYSGMSLLSEDEEQMLRAKANILGIAVHRLMELIVTSKGNIEVDLCIRAIADESVAIADSEYKSVLIKALKEVYKVITTTGFKQSNESEQDIYSILINADEVFCEVPFCYQEGEEIWNGIMDVIYREGDKWYIVDYKTNGEVNGLDVKYSNQLAAYINAFEMMTGITASARIYHIDI